MTGLPLDLQDVLLSLEDTLQLNVLSPPTFKITIQGRNNKRVNDILVLLDQKKLVEFRSD